MFITSQKSTHKRIVVKPSATCLSLTWLWGRETVAVQTVNFKSWGGFCFLYKFCVSFLHSSGLVSCICVFVVTLGWKGICNTACWKFKPLWLYEFQLKSWLYSTQPDFWKPKKWKPYLKLSPSENLCLVNQIGRAKMTEVWLRVGKEKSSSSFPFPLVSPYLCFAQKIQPNLLWLRHETHEAHT